MTDTQKKCLVSGTEFVVTDSDRQFYRMMDVPEPQICPKERVRRLMAERNARSLYYRQCDGTKKRILSQFHPDSPFPVYSPEYWWGDSWDAIEHGRDFDFSKPFFSQLLELKNAVPHLARFVIFLENSEYTNCTGYLKNCYLISESDYDEDCYFSNRIYHCKDLIDCSNCYGCEVGHECIDCRDCFSLFYSQDCGQCHDSYFLYDCLACKDCIGCINQRQKQYMIFNKQFSKSEYQSRLKEMRLDTRSGIEELRRKCDEIFPTQPHRPLQEEHNENSLGDHLYNSKNSYYCFDAKDLEDCRYCYRVANGVKSSMDYSSWGFGAERVYCSSSCGDGVYNLRFCSTCTTNLSDATYCLFCTGSRDLFGCVSLRRNQYCILNKQYSESEYKKLIPKIIDHMKSTGEWGSYFPTDLCSFAYNETIAMENFPLSKRDAIKLGYRWRDDPAPVEHPTKGFIIPDRALDASDAICGEVLACELSGTRYKLISQELAFYKRFGVPIPLRSPKQRHADRYARRNPYELFTRKCADSGETIATSYAPSTNSLIYSKESYLRFVYD